MKSKINNLIVELKKSINIAFIVTIISLLVIGICLIFLINYPIKDNMVKGFAFFAIAILIYIIFFIIYKCFKKIFKIIDEISEAKTWN